MSTAVTDALRMLMDLRAQLVHVMKQRNISADKFNDIRAQLLPLDEKLRTMGVDLDPPTQANPNYQVRPNRKARRRVDRAHKFTDRITKWAQHE